MAVEQPIPAVMAELLLISYLSGKKFFAALAFFVLI